MIYFFDCPDFIYKTTRKIAALFGDRVEKLSYAITDIRDEDGFSIRLKIAYGLIATVQSTIQNAKVYKKFIENIGDTSRLKHYLSKSICDYHALGVDAYRYVWNAVILLNVFLWFSKQETKPHETYIFLEKRIWWDALLAHAAGSKAALVPLAPKFKLRYLLSPHDRLYLRHAYNNLAKNRRTGTIPSDERDDDGPFIAAEYFGHLNLDTPEYYSDLFFMHQSRLEGSDLKLLFRLREAPLDEKMKAELQDHGVHPVVLDKKASLVPDIQIHRFGIQHRRTRVLKGFSREEKWLREEVSEYDWYYSYWLDIFAKQNIKVFIEWYKYDAEHIARADAMQALGGISTIYQRSFEARPTPETTLSLDIEFGFSMAEATLERDNNSHILYHVATGYPGDYRFNLLRERAAQLRKSLEMKGARNIVALFDENTADDPRWFCGHEFVKSTYTFWLQKVIENPRFGLIIKPKKPDNLRQRLGDAGELLDNALKTGRCHIFMHGILQGSPPPAIASLAADVAIHDSLSSGTAGLESALAGTPTLLMDFDGWPGNKLYKLGVGRVVFNDWDVVWEAITQFFTSAKALKGFGDWQEMIDQLDPFRDGRAAERIGTYLTWLLDGFKAGEKRDDIMSQAAERYGKQWGYDKIARVP